MITLRKLLSLERLVSVPANALLHAYDPGTGKDYYVLAGDLLAGLSFPTWNTASAVAGDYDVGTKVQHGFRLWQSLVNDNQTVPSEGASWTEISPTVDNSNAVKFIGPWDFSANLFPAAGGTGPGGSVAKGNMFEVSVVGTIPGGDLLPVGTFIMAKVDNPGQTSGNWRKLF